MLDYMGCFMLCSMNSMDFTMTSSGWHSEIRFELVHTLRCNSHAHCWAARLQVEQADLLQRCATITPSPTHTHLSHLLSISPHLRRKRCCCCCCCCCVSSFRFVWGHAGLQGLTKLKELYLSENKILSLEGNQIKLNDQPFHPVLFHHLLL